MFEKYWKEHQDKKAAYRDFIDCLKDKETNLIIRQYREYFDHGFEGVYKEQFNIASRSDFDFTSMIFELEKLTYTLQEINDGIIKHRRMSSVEAEKMGWFFGGLFGLIEGHLIHHDPEFNVKDPREMIAKIKDRMTRIRDWIEKIGNTFTEVERESTGLKNLPPIKINLLHVEDRIRFAEKTETRSPTFQKTLSEIADTLKPLA